jgi:hypothetical protein
MARKHGKNGQVYLDCSATGVPSSPTLVLGIKSFSIHGTGEASDGTGMDSGGSKEYTIGNNDATISCEAWWDTSETKTRGNPPKIIESMACRFVGKLTPTGSDYWECLGIITGMSVNVTVDGNTSWTLEIQRSGAWLHFPT